MNCDAVGYLMEDYLDNELSQRERDLVDEHLSRCYRCQRELRQRPAVERSIRRAISGSVRPMALSSAASARMIHLAEQSLQRARWSHRVSHLVQGAVAVATLCLVLAGILFLTRSLPVPDRLQPIALLPVSQASLDNRGLAHESLQRQAAPRSTDVPEVATSEVSMIFEPRIMHPNQPFTITVFLWSDEAQPVDTVSLDLDVNGPTGYYSFDLTLQEPLPSQGVSVLKVTPKLLSEPCEEQYLMSPTEMFATTGVYDVRVTMTKPVAGQRRRP